MRNRELLRKELHYFWKRVRSCILAVLLCLLAASNSLGATPVERHGRLSVHGKYILDQHGRHVQLRGMSLYWSQWAEGSHFYNSEVISHLAKDWNCSVVRAAMGVYETHLDAPPDGYIVDPREADKVRTVVNAAIENGIYVIIDWHTHEIYKNEALEFFETMAREFGQHPNIIYEIFNEPGHRDIVSWKDHIKPYATDIVNAIRSIDPHNLIIIGTPHWSQDVDVASEDPVSGINLVYALHFYAGDEAHRNTLRNKAQKALDNNVALFVSEWGTTTSDGGGIDGLVFVRESDIWLNWLDRRKISWLNWSISIHPEASAALHAHASVRGGWMESDLKESGRYVKKRLLSEPKYASVLPFLHILLD